MSSKGPTQEEIWEALVESVKLQSHYAQLLNMHDGGQRMLFKDPHALIERLRQSTSTPSISSLNYMGWNDESRLALMQQFISQKFMDEEFELFLRTKAKEELEDV